MRILVGSWQETVKWRFAVVTFCGLRICRACQPFRSSEKVAFSLTVTLLTPLPLSRSVLILLLDPSPCSQRYWTLVTPLSLTLILAGKLISTGHCPEKFRGDAVGFVAQTLGFDAAAASVFAAAAGAASNPVTAVAAMATPAPSATSLPAKPVDFMR